MSINLEKKECGFPRPKLYYLVLYLIIGSIEPIKMYQVNNRVYSPITLYKEL